MRIYHYLIATCLGTGFIPIAPGTMGSIVALAVFWFLPVHFGLQMGLIIVFFFLGVWSSGQVEKEKGNDPGLVNIDEVVGQWITLLMVGHHWLLYLIGFGLFRLFDIWKPFPIDRTQKIRGGWGIMVDDVLAGIYALIVIKIIVTAGVLP